MSGQASHAAFTYTASEASPLGSRPAEEADDSALVDLDEAALRMAIEVLRFLRTITVCTLHRADCSDGKLVVAHE